jgi:hypothetical protein
MSWKPSDRFIQITAGLVLLTTSVFFLWKDTLQPISAGLRKEGVLKTNLRQGLRYLTGQGPEEEWAREQEKIRLEEEALQRKLDQLRKKREALAPPSSTPPSDPTAPSPSARPANSADTPESENPSHPSRSKPQNN